MEDLYTGIGLQWFNHIVGITFAYDLFDPVGRKAKAAQARLETRQAGTTYSSRNSG
jgi:hypothetical protein